MLACKVGADLLPIFALAMLHEEDEGTEAEALSDYTEAMEEPFEERVSDMIIAYGQSKQANVRTKVECPTCTKTFIKRYWQQAFCCTPCRDKYHNTVTEERRVRARHYGGTSNGYDNR
jgi:protein-arginine kinase activator protein McsA